MTFDAGAIEARLILNRQQFQADLAAARSEGDSFDGKKFEARAGLNYDQVKAALAKIAAEWDSVKAQLQRPADLNVDTGEVNAKIAATEAAFEALRSSLSQDIQLRADTSAASKVAQAVAASAPVEQQLTINPAEAYQALQDIQDRYLELRVMLEQSPQLRVDGSAFEASLAKAIDQLNLLRTQLAAGNVLNIDDAPALRAIAETTAAFEAMKATLGENISLSPVTGGGANAVSGEVAAEQQLATALDRATQSATRNTQSTAAMTAANQDATKFTTAFGTSVGFLKTHYDLFGGALNGVLPNVLATVTGFHLIADGIIEITGTLIPATIAFGAFGIAATPTVVDLYKQMSSLFTVTQAFNTELYPLTGNFQKVADAVKPEVYVLFGEALVEAGHNTGAFQTLATGAGKALDDLGARFVYATTQSKTFSSFVTKASQDLAGWGNLIGNIGGIFGNVLKVLPGYAEAILNVLNGVTHALEVITGSGFGQGLLSIGLAAHGALVYIGLLATGFALLAKALVSGLATGALNLAVGLSRIGPAGEAAAEGVLAFGAASETVATSTPWGWVSVAAAALAYFVYRIVTAKDAVQELNDKIQQNLQNAPLTSLVTDLSSAYQQVQQKLDGANKSLQQFTQENGAALKAQSELYRNAAGTPLQHQYQQLSQAAQDYAQGLQMVKADQQTLNQHIAQAATVFGGTKQAWAALNDAGVTSAQILDSNKQHWAEAMIEAQAYNDAIRATTQTTGRYGAAQNALNFTAGDTVNALGQLDASMTKVTQAEDQLFNVLIGGEQAFTSFQQAIGTASGNLAGGLAQAAHVAGASIGGLNAQSLNLANSFYSTALPAAQKQIDALQMQAINTNQLQTVTATMAGELLQYAGNNVAARTAVVDLINNALGPGTVSLQNLNKWVGQNSTSMAGYKSIVDQATGAASQLAGVLQQDVLQMMAQATAAAYGGQKAFSQFAQALVENQTQGTAFNQVGTNVIQTLITSTGNADAAHRQFDMFTESLGYSKAAADALWTSLSHQLLVDAAQKSGETYQAFINLANQLGITKQQADAVWYSLSRVSGGSPYSAVLHESGTGLFTITGSLIQQSQGPGGSGNAAGGLASGAYITAGSGPTADDVLAFVSKGELVVPAHIVASGAVDHLRGMIPGFAGGAYMSPGNVTGLANLAGATTTDWNDFATDMTNAMKSAMTDTMKQAQAAAAKAAAAAISTAGVSNSSAVAALQSAAAKRGWTGAEWVALNNVEMREAGYNLYATNPSSGAYGMAQFINGPTEYYQYGGNPNTAAGQAVAMVNYIAQRYGDPIAAWNHELAFGWYDNGGFLRPGWTLAYNGTGQDEPVGNNSNFGDVVQQLSQISNQLQSIFGWPGPDRRPPVGGNAGGNALTAPYGYLTGGNASTFGGFVGDYTGIVSPLGNGFGLTATQLGLPPPPSSSSGSSGAGAGGTGGTGTGSGGGTPTPTPPPKHTGPNPAQQAAINVLKGLMSGYIWHNEMAQAGQANALLNWLGVGSYNAQLSEIAQLNTLVLRYRKEKKRAAELSAEHVLTQFGVHVFTPQTSAKGNKPHDSVVKKLESLMSGDIATNNMSAAGQVNSLLTALGVGRYSRELSEINNLDSLLAKFKKAKNAGEIRAIETLLQQYGVKKFDLGGTWPNMTLGVNTSGRTETVVSGAGMDQLVDRLERLLAVANAQLNATRAQPQATASRISNALANTPLHGVGMARRYSNNR